MGIMAWFKRASRPDARHPAAVTLASLATAAAHERRQSHRARVLATMATLRRELGLPEWRP